MKKNLFIILAGITFGLTACNNNQSDNSALIAEIEKKYQDSLGLLKNQLKDANETIRLLKFPADQRLAHIVELYNSELYEAVKKDASDLKKMFPNAKENAEADKYLAKIEAIEAAKKAEEDRIAAEQKEKEEKEKAFQEFLNKMTPEEQYYYLKEMPTKEPWLSWPEGKTISTIKKSGEKFVELEQDVNTEKGAI